MKVNLKMFLSVFVLGAGICLMFYPWISNRLYSYGVDSAVDVYQKELVDTDAGVLDGMLEDAGRYNDLLAASKVVLTDPFSFSGEEDLDITYESVLSVDGTGLMCFINIPKIDVYLPVYHGTSEEVLEKGAGHLEGTSVPVGGERTHAVLSAHTGISSSKMFTDLTEMETGDLFFIRVLDKQLAYRVCDIQVILPEDTSSLVIENGRDLVTLLTCTPYGVNTHRLIVTGERTEYTETAKAEEESEIASSDSQWMKEYKKALLIGLSAVSMFVGIIKLSGYLTKKINRIRHEQEETV